MEPRLLPRRSFILTTAAIALAHGSAAFGQPERPYRIGALGNEDTPHWNGFRQGLRDLGYIEGKNVVVEWRWSEGKPDRLPALAVELVERKVDVMVVSSTQAARAAKQATDTIPIVTTVTSYPDRIGLVDSLARPGGNITGLTNVAPDLTRKRVDLLKELVPRLTRLTLLWNPGNPLEELGYGEVLAGAAAAGVTLASAEARTPEALPDALASLSKARPDAIYAFGNPINFRGRKVITSFAAENRLPSLFEERLFVQEGGLVSYAPSFTDLFRRAATYVDKILNGAKAADLPIEQPTVFELVINMRTAKLLGLDVHPALLARTDVVIE